MRRIGFEATARIDRHDFGVSWQDEIPGGGVVGGNEIDLSLDVEAILLDDLERTGAIDYYRRTAPAAERYSRGPSRSRTSALRILSPSKVRTSVLRNRFPSVFVLS